MARKIPTLADWNAVRFLFEGPRVELWTRFAAELADDLIVTPLLFGAPTDRESRGQACTLPVRGPLVLHARGDEHLRVLLDEVRPRLAGLRSVYLLDADRRCFYPAQGDGSPVAIDLLPALVCDALRQEDPLAFDTPESAARVEEQLRRAFRALPARREVEAFLALPAIQARIARAAAVLEDVPIRLWEAMLWRGDSYRWELINGEVPLVGELFSPQAARRTLDQCLLDAERVFSAPRQQRGDGWACGPLRLWQRGSRVELRLRLAAPDRFCAFLPRASAEREEGLPSLLGVLLAGGGKGKTELVKGYTDSIIQLHERHDPGQVIEHLEVEIRRITGARVEVDDPEAGWPDAAGGWHLKAWQSRRGDRFVGVWMPLRGGDSIAWQAQAGLHLADDFMAWSQGFQPDPSRALW